MKKITMAIIMMAASVCAFAQVPVTAGLQLHLDAAVGFNDNGPAAATWTDLSPLGLNNMAAASNLLEPTYTVNVLGSGFDGVHFDGTSNYMTNTLNSTMNNTEASIFVVRIGQNPNTANSGLGYQSMVSIARDNGSWEDEFGMGADWAMHHSSSGNWMHLHHQCYSSVPTTRPVIISGIYGLDEADIDFVINDIHSSLTNFQQGFPWDYIAQDRKIALGARYQGSPVSTSLADYYDGYILEVLVYDRKLSTLEQHDVNEYLKCKYDINYSAQMCNNTQDLKCDGCFRSDYLQVTQTGNDIRGNCMFTATATGIPRPGVTILGYRWTIPGMADFVVTTGATSNSQPFILPPFTAGVVKVVIYAVKTQWGPDESPCCEWSDSKQVSCKQGGHNKMTGIDNTDMGGITIYPNPTDKYVNIQNGAGISYRVSVTDFTGRQIMTKDLSAKPVQELSLEGKAAGVYMIQLSDKDGNIIKTQKLVLQ